MEKISFTITDDVPVMILRSWVDFKDCDFTVKHLSKDRLNIEITPDSLTQWADRLKISYEAAGLNKNEAEHITEFVCDELEGVLSFSPDDDREHADMYFYIFNLLSSYATGLNAIRQITKGGVNYYD